MFTVTQVTHTELRFWNEHVQLPGPTVFTPYLPELKTVYAYSSNSSPKLTHLIERPLFPVLNTLTLSLNRIMNIYDT